jgi:hypothetical protein
MSRPTQGFSIRMNGIIGFLFLIAVIVAIFFIAKGIFKLLYFAAPVLIVLALIINYRTVVGFFRWLFGLYKRSVLTGIIATILTIIGYPLVCGLLFGKSILDRKIRNLQQAQRKQREGEFVEFEDVSRPTREEKLDLPPMEKTNPSPKENPYKDLF